MPISSEPIPEGAIAIDRGNIAAIGDRSSILEEYPSAEIEDFGEAAILPGLVNCHSHLEVTAMRGALDDVEHDFRSWLLKLNGLRAAMTEAEIIDAARNGAIEGAQAGITCFGDIGRFGMAGVEALKSVGLRGVLFQETEFSPDDRSADDDFDALRQKFEALRRSANDLVEIGLSPHSPYTVSARLFRLIADFARSEGVKITVHAAESDEEDALMRNGTGFFTEVYRKFGVEWKSPCVSSISYLASTGILAANPLLVHCVSVTDADIKIIADNRASIAHCPKSNAKFGHGCAPLEAFLNAGIAVGLGSDSVASNNVCDLLEESRFAALAARNRRGRNGFISAREALEMATLGGAKALGLDHLIGTLEPSKNADIAVISLAHQAQRPVNEIHAAIVFSSNARDVIATIVNGKTIYSRNP